MPNGNSQEDNEYRYSIDDMLLVQVEMDTPIVETDTPNDNGQEGYEYRTMDDMLLASEMDITATTIGAAPHQGDDSTQVAEIPASVPAAMAPAVVPGAKKRGRPKGSKDKVQRTRRKRAEVGGQ
jgi:hypothetical protein